MIDLFHLQLIKGNITNTLNDLKSHIGHVQVSRLYRLYRFNGGKHIRAKIKSQNRLISKQYLIFVAVVPFLLF